MEDWMIEMHIFEWDMRMIDFRHRWDFYNGAFTLLAAAFLRLLDVTVREVLVFCQSGICLRLLKQLRKRASLPPMLWPRRVIWGSPGRWPLRLTVLGWAQLSCWDVPVCHKETAESQQLFLKALIWRYLLTSYFLQSSETTQVLRKS